MNQKHIFFYKLVRPLVILFLKLRFGYTFEVARQLPKNYIVVSNHATDYDMLLVAASFPEQMYFVASEHVARWGLLSKLLNICFAPIWRPKGASAASTVMDMVRKARKGDNVCLFAEGVRTWDGTTCPIPPATGRLIKTAGCGLVTYKIAGGYFASPMWGGASVRRGWLHGAPVTVYTPEMLSEMTAQQVQAAIEADLFEDAYARQLADPKPYRCKAPAKGLETLLFRCPQCGAIDCFTTHGDTVTCGSCALSMQYTQYGFLENSPFPTLRDFSLWQNEQVAEDAARCVAYTTDFGDLSVIEGHEDTYLCSGAVTMTPEALTCGDRVFPLQEISDLSMFGQRSLVFTAQRTYYQLKPAPGSNVLKFLLYYQAVKANSKTKAGT